MNTQLYLVSVPIGHMGDITYRAVETLKSVDVILCEDTRVTKELLKEIQVDKPLENYHEHNASEKRPEIFKRMHSGVSFALVSDAGTPLISDPGYRLVKEAREKNIKITANPGACAAINALVLSGQPTSQFFFYGFLPNKSSARIKKLEELASIPSSLVFYESPHRIQESLEDCLKVFGESVELSLVREMTKKYETVLSGTIAEVVQRTREEKIKGEIVLVVSSEREKKDWTEESIKRLLKEKLEVLSLKDAVKEVVKITAWPKKQVYQWAVELSG